jgi:hypothetical protein
VLITLHKKQLCSRIYKQARIYGNIIAFLALQARRKSFSAPFVWGTLIAAGINEEAVLNRASFLLYFRAYLCLKNVTHPTHVRDETKKASLWLAFILQYFIKGKEAPRR